MVQPRRRSSPPEDPFADPPAVPDRSVVSQHHQPRSSFSSAGHSDSGDRDYGDHDYHARARLVENTAALVSVSSPYSGDKGKHKWDDVSTHTRSQQPDQILTLYHSLVTHTVLAPVPLQAVPRPPKISVGTQAL